MGLIDIRVNKKLDGKNIKEVYFAIYIIKDLHAVIGNIEIVDFCKPILKYLEPLREQKAPATDDLIKAFFLINDHLNVLIENFRQNESVLESTINESEILKRSSRSDINTYIETIGVQKKEKKVRKVSSHDLDDSPANTSSPDTQECTTDDECESMVGVKSNYLVNPDTKLTIENTEAIMEKINSEISEHSVAQIDIDLSQVVDFDSAGLEFLVNLHKICKGRSVKVNYLGLSDNVINLLELYNIHLEDLEVE